MLCRIGASGGMSGLCQPDVSRVLLHVARWRRWHREHRSDRDPCEPQPAYVYQWFPDAVAPTDATPYGRGTRKHAIGLSFVIDLQGNPQPQNEALDFAYFAPDALPEPLWPGCRHLLERLLS